MLISFAWTTNAFLADAKTCTRRNWDDKYTEKFIRAYHDKRSIKAYNKSPRVLGHQIGLIQLTQCPFKQRTGLMNKDDYKEEGLLWMDLRGERVNGKLPRDFFHDWILADELVWVIKFIRIRE